MNNALIISRIDKGTDFFRQTLAAAGIGGIETAGNCSEARRLIQQRDFDLVVINAPLADETGEALSRDIVSRGSCQVILVVKNEYYDAVSAVLAASGVLVVSRPINAELFWSACMVAQASFNRIKMMQAENNELRQRLEDIRIIDRAKCLLISRMNMSEPEAHRHIEKQAMDLRTTKRLVAEGILKTYEY